MSNPQAKLLREWFDWGDCESSDVAMQSADYIDNQAALIRELVQAIEKHRLDVWGTKDGSEIEVTMQEDAALYAVLSRVPEEYRG